MDSITETMSEDHRRCDELFAAAEEPVGTADWTTAAVRYGAFRQAMDRHFAREEEVLFPRFEEASGSAMGPTEVMRMEHAQMRALFDEMAAALERRDGDGYLGASETLLVLMQQHNLKEERILYPMTDQVLADGRTAVLGEMERVTA